MKRICALFALCIVLCGCASAPPAEPVEAVAVIATEETAPATTAATEPADPLETLLSWMTIEERVGQLFLARCPASDAAAELSVYPLGGYILYARDFTGHTPTSFSRTLSSYQNASAIPLLIAVDEEGGTVCRVSSYHTFRDVPFGSPRNLFAQGGMEAVLDAEQEKAEFLSSLGICVNMAPVCDVTTNTNAFMYARSLGQSPETTADFVSATVKIMDAQHVGSVLKHFPGYGNNTDTHTGMAVDSRSLQELEDGDLIPFQAGIQAGCDAILMSHTIVTCLDDTLPVSLSPAAHQYLRQEMGFERVIVTDDLDMGAITDAYGSEEAAILAVLAGNDLLCSTEYAIQYQAVLEAVNSGRIPMETVDAAVMRILRWKQDLGLLF